MNESTVDTTNSFGYWVRRRRKAMDLTQADLAKRVGCAPVTIKKIERDERRPSRQMAALLADQLIVAASERETFISIGRSEIVTAQIQPPQPIQPPAFLAAVDESSKQEKYRSLAVYASWPTLAHISARLSKETGISFSLPGRLVGAKPA